MRIALWILAMLFALLVWFICHCLCILRKLEVGPREGSRLTKRMEMQLAIAVAFELECLYQKSIQAVVRLGTMMGWLAYITFWTHVR